MGWARLKQSVLIDDELKGDDMKNNLIEQMKAAGVPPMVVTAVGYQKISENPPKNFKVIDIELTSDDVESLSVRLAEILIDGLIGDGSEYASVNISPQLCDRLIAENGTFWHKIRPSVTVRGDIPDEIVKLVLMT